MNAPFHILLPIVSAAFLTAEPSLDYLHFKNGDALHGHYQGLENGNTIKWLSQESPEEIIWETKNLRKLTLHNGPAQNALKDPGLVVLNNDDNIPGSLVAMDKNSVTLQTEFAGLLTIPRQHVAQIYPNRHGGHVLYAGPFNDTDWSVPFAELPENEPPLPKNKEGEEVDPAPKPGWVHAGASWINNSSQVLRLAQELPSRVSIRFNLAWKTSPLNATIGIFTDFQRPLHDGLDRIHPVLPVAENPEDAEKDADANEAAEEAVEEAPQFVDIMKKGVGTSTANIYGSGYVISILSTYSRLQRVGFDEDLKEKKTSFPNSGGRLNLSDLSSADFEIRSDRTKGVTTLFVNGQFYAEWQDLSAPLDDSPRYFSITTGRKSKIRISDVVVSKWNGMTDSAKSMQTEERDVLLLTNGTDRVSGKILTLAEGVFHIQTDYGLFQIPAHDVTDIQLATNTIADPPENGDKQIIVSFQPKGRLSFQPKEGLAEVLRGVHPILGELSLDLSSAYLLEFDVIGSIFDNWDDEF